MSMLTQRRSGIFSVGNMNSLAGNVKLKPKYVRSPILKSIDPNINNDKNAAGHEPICNISDLQSLNLLDDDEHGESGSVLLLDDSENLRMNTEASFLAALNIPPNEKVKVVSIFGNTGEGKSYTLNEVFFNGEQVFRTSPSQTSCTLGVWAKYHPTLKLICLDTEGALGISKKENQRIRLHLKVLAISDIVIYRTRAERLHRDMYTFLGEASKAYTDHFSVALKKALSKNAADTFSNPIGPGVVIFHETRLTETLRDGAGLTQSAEDVLQATFADLRLPLDAFSFLKYVGVRTHGPKTSFDELRAALLERLESTEVRTRRDARYVYLTLKSLNEKFKNKLSDATPQMYLPAFFTCSEKCQSCNSGCSMSVGHKEEGEPHQSKSDCTFQHQYQNNVYLCKACHKNGVRNIVKPSYQTTTDNSWTGYFSYVWSGYVIECSRCGEIYRSRQHWYGNREPEDMAVRTEVVHVWPGEQSLFGTQNPAQRIIDGVSSLTGVIASAGSQPTRMISDWAADRIAPSYWRPNNEIRVCNKCETPFGDADSKHHCRACGEGFCDGCSSRRQPVPARGWPDDVRVCDDCYREEPPSLTPIAALDGAENRARQIGEKVVYSLSAVKSVLDIPKGFIKATARPSYWTPDGECSNCAVCARPFAAHLPLHHCRDCGRGVCDDCSPARKPVPARGWPAPVRVCDGCR